MNIILNVDSYKTSHFLQYPPGSTHVSSYIEARGGDFKKAIFFGLQMFIKERLLDPVIHEDIEEAEDILLAHGVPFNRRGWQHIVKQHGGFLPIEIQAVGEGMGVPIQNVLVQVVNTDPECAWLTSYVETALVRAVWYPTTVATLSWHCREVIKKYLEETADTIEGLPFKLHDFGARGTSSEQSAGIGGAAHLVNFSGTDTISGVMAVRRFYAHTDKNYMPAFSIPAAEHSTITCWGREKESEAYANMLAQFAKPDQLVAVVSDSYDLWHAIDHIWGQELRSLVENTGGTLVVRPDSGHPPSIVCTVIEKLMDRFGKSTNSKGYQVLPDCIRVLQGDGISLPMIGEILEAMKQHKLSADNIAFGMGGELLQKVHRDTMQFAMKASAIMSNGTWGEVYKDPVTDHGKRSKKGRLALIKKDGEIITIPEKDIGRHENLLKPVFRNGELLKEWTFNEVRANANTQELSQ